jgi:uncharacterized protein YaiI (UPF0178 family)
MPTLYIDAAPCPVKDEAVRVAGRLRGGLHGTEIWANLCP